MADAAISPAELDELLEIARAGASAGAVIALEWTERANERRTEEKAASDDLVSQADREAERAIRDVLSRHRPNDAIVGEECEPSHGASGVEWVLDPIDGTMSYLYGRPDWAVSVAAVRRVDGVILAGVVAEPALGRTVAARLGGGAWNDGLRLELGPEPDLSRSLVEVNLGRPEQRRYAGRLFDALVPRVRDVRRGGSAAAALAGVATGRCEAYWGPGLQAWDGAAGALIVREAGGVVGDLSGPGDGTWPESGNVLATAASLFEPLRAIIAEAFA